MAIVKRSVESKFFPTQLVPPEIGSETLAKENIGHSTFGNCTYFVSFFFIGGFSIGNIFEISSSSTAENYSFDDAIDLWKGSRAHIGKLNF